MSNLPNVPVTVLQSQDGEEFSLPVDVAKQSGLIRSMLEDQDGEPDQDQDQDVIPLPNVKRAVLAEIIEFCRHRHAAGPMEEIEKPLKSANMRELVSEWDASFVDKLDQKMLFELVMAAIYMDIQSLLDLAGAKIASRSTGHCCQWPTCHILHGCISCRPHVRHRGLWGLELPCCNPHEYISCHHHVRHRGHSHRYQTCHTPHVHTSSHHRAQHTGLCCLELPWCSHRTGISSRHHARHTSHCCRWPT